MQNNRTSGNDEFLGLLAEDAGNDAIIRKTLVAGNLLHGLAVNQRIFFDKNHDNRALASAEAGHLAHLGLLDFEHELVDEEVGDVDGAGDAGDLVSGLVTRAAHARHDARHLEVAREQSERHVVSIVRQRRYRHIGLLHPGLFEHFDVGGGAMNNQRAEPANQVFTDRLFALDDHHVVPVGHQTARQAASDHASACNHHIHVSSPTSSTL